MAVTNVSQLAKVVCPDLPETKKVHDTMDRVSWYMIVGDTLRVPPMNVLKTNMLELDRFSEAVNNFAHTEQESFWNEDELELDCFDGFECTEKFQELQNILQNKRVAVDIETRGLGYEDNVLLSIGFAWDDNKCWAFKNIPIKGSQYDVNATPDQMFRCYNKFKALLTDPSITYIWHNGKFDCNRLNYMCMISARVDEDTMLKHYACINEKRGTHGLKELGQLYLQAPAWDDKLDQIKREFCKKNKIKLADFTYDIIPVDTLIPYMQRDCIATYKLLERFEQLARPESDFIYRKLCEASNVYGRVELNGVQVDVDHLDDLDFDLEMEIKEAQKNFDQVAGKIWDPAMYAQETGAKVKLTDKFNMKSPKQLKWMLSKVMGYQINSTDALTIDGLVNDCENGLVSDPLAKQFLESIAVLRKANKYMDTYVQGIRKVLCRDLRVRGTYNLHGTETGRLSSNNPNMQNIPRNKKIKNIICAKKGYRLVQLDYSQAELRVLAMLSGDQSMIDTYNAGIDLHDAVAKDMFGPDFTKEQRNMAKTINFGIAYGRGATSISENFGKSRAESQEIIDKWFQSKPMVKKYIDTQRRKPLRGEPCTTLLGRRRHFVITDETLYHVQNEYINTPIQSVASDFTMLSLLNIDKFIEASGIDAKIIATVHDSIILEVEDKPETIDLVARTCKDIMAKTPLQYVPDCPVPFRADVETGYSWGALEEWDTKC